MSRLKPLDGIFQHARSFVRHESFVYPLLGNVLSVIFNDNFSGKEDI
jgi:hypothetical protein